MTILSIDEALVTTAVIEFLRGTDANGDPVVPAADLSTDESANTGVVLVGDHYAPAPAAGDDMLAQIDIASGMMDPYLVVYQVPMGGAGDREARSGYAGGTPSTKVLRWQIVAIALERPVAQRLAQYAVARLSDPPYPAIVIADHEISRWERIGPGTPDWEGNLFQWTEFVEADVSRAL